MRSEGANRVKRIIFKTRTNGMSREGALLFLFGCLVILMTGSFVHADEVEFRGELEARVSFDTNPLLTADDYDFELRQLPIDKTEEEDLFATLAGDLRLRIPLKEYYDQYLRLQFEGVRFADLDEEHRERVQLEISPVIHLSRELDLIFKQSFDFDNRRDGAEYLRPDYLHSETGLGLEWRPGLENMFWIGYFYETRHYDNLTGTPFDDFDGHHLRAGYRRIFSKAFRADVEARYRWREYDEDTRDAFGALISGDERDEDRWEVRTSATWLPWRNTLLRLGYLYRNNSSPGEFYDYDVHRVSGIWIQQFTPKVQLRAYTHYDWRDYDDQLAQRTVVNPVTDIAGQVFDDERSDNQLFGLVSLSNEFFPGVIGGVEFQYLKNDSNDDSSEYESQRYSVFVKYRF